MDIIDSKGEINTLIFNKNLLRNKKIQAMKMKSGEYKAPALFVLSFFKRTKWRRMSKQNKDKYSRQQLIKNNQLCDWKKLNP